MTDEQREGLEWIRSRPPEVQEVMKRFPPSCRVMANRPLHVPGPGRVGVVASYQETDGRIDVSVVDEQVYLGLAKYPDIRASCRLEWLEVVGYHGNMTPEWVEKVLAGEDIPPELEDSTPPGNMKATCSRCFKEFVTGRDEVDRTPLCADCTVDN